MPCRCDADCPIPFVSTPSRRTPPGARGQTEFHRVATEYRCAHSSELTISLCAVFESELLRLFRSIRPRLPCADERWSLVCVCFLASVAAADALELDACSVNRRMRKAVFKDIRLNDNRRRREKSADFQSKKWAWLECSGSNSDAEEVFADLCHRLRAAMEALSPMDRAVVEATCLHGYSEREAAKKLGLSRSALHRRLARAKAALARGVGLPLPEPGKARSQ